MAGLVYTNEERFDKPGEKVKADIPLKNKGECSFLMSAVGA